jgi:hypothetical protein
MDASIPAPTGGLNARDSLDNMHPMDAVRLTNLVPKETHLEMRKGYEVVVDSLGDACETLAVYNGETSNDLLIAYGGKIDTLNVSTGATSTKGSGFSTDQWQTININDKLVFVNGSDTPQEYNGTTLSAMASLSGPTVTTLDGVMTFKGRAVYWSQGKQSFWYAAAGAHAGALTEFPIDFVAQEGGGIMECVTWTRDSGEGIDDLFIVLMESGETIVYQGTDFASDFSMIGRFDLGQPLSIRGSCNLASDRVIITKDGYINLSTALSQARINQSNNIGHKIVNLATNRTSRHADNYGWELKFLPSESMLVVNIPIDTGATASDNSYIQHVMNTNTGAWCKFNRIQSITWIDYDSNVYFATSSGEVMKYTGSNDNGDYIIAKMLPAFNSFEIKAFRKQLTMCTVTTDYHAPKYIQIQALREFNISAIEKSLRLPPQSVGALWDVPDWDSVEWDADTTEYSEDVKAFTIPTGIEGYALTVKIRFASKTQTAKIYSIKYKLKKGRAI